MDDWMVYLLVIALMIFAYGYAFPIFPSRDKHENMKK